MRSPPGALRYQCCCCRDVQHGLLSPSHLRVTDHLAVRVSFANNDAAADQLANYVTTNQPTNQSADQPTDQPANQPADQPANRDPDHVAADLPTHDAAADKRAVGAYINEPADNAPQPEPDR